MLWGNNGGELVQSALSLLSFLSLLQTVIPELQNSNCSGAPSRSVSILQVPPMSPSVTSLWLCFGYEMTTDKHFIYSVKVSTFWCAFIQM